MNMIRALAVGIAALLLPVGCNDEPKRVLDSAVEPPPIDGGASNLPGQDEACLAGRRVGRLLEGTDCPEAAEPAEGPGRWTVAHLFDRREVDGAPLPVPDPEAAFCVYTWEDDPEPREDLLPADRQRPAEVWLDRDCAVAGGQQTDDGPGDLRRVIWEPMRAAFLETVQTPEAAPPLGVGGADDPYPRGVRVAIVDTAADADPGGPGTFEHAQHGRAMGLFVRELACPDCPPLPDPPGPAQVEITNHAALDIVEPGRRDPVRGGRYGYQGHLAWGIYDAVARWMRDLGPGVDGPDIRPRLVINLSVGWDPNWQGADDGEDGDRQSAVAVRLAIEHAVCSGALVIAAAGNDFGGGNAPSGPMYPGAWERAPLPDRCARAVGGDYPALVHAVGGVDGRDLPLGNARAAGRPRLAAGGFYAITELEPDRPTGFFTGTSVSTAVVSAAAALVWRYLPDLTGAEVMDRVYGSGALLPGENAANQTPDFCLYPNGCQNVPIRRITACRALQAALQERCGAAEPPQGCGDLDLVGLCRDVPPFSGDNRRFDVDAVTPNAEEDAADLGEPVTAPGCSYTTQTVAGAPPPDAPSPDEQFYNGGMAPWAVLPQPENPGCDVCSLVIVGAQGSLVLGINKTFDATLHSAKLVLSNGIAFDLAAKFGLGGLVPGQIYKLVGLSIPASPFTTAKLTFSFTRDGKTWSGASVVPWWRL